MPSLRAAHRRVIANAAYGRTPVALHLCADHEVPISPALLSLRSYASARDWTIALEVIERESPAVPVQRRACWPELEEAITSGRVSGVVTLARSMWPIDGMMHDWLDDHHAFVVAVTREEVTAP
ncbi:hypothetical protein [Streptomyces cacaoi]|uniref:hypothetical protein n=1 Tax=Streptomyces cacaoi TaxID=1898 RepID=UPI0011F11A04|nr:hypothetical protein [Streptomyces cacaoi]